MLISRYGEECKICSYNKFENINDLQFEIRSGVKLYDDLKTPDVIYNLIVLFHESYSNTNIDTVTFGKEFYTVVDNLTSGVVPLELEFLAVDEIVDEIEEILETGGKINE